VSLITSSNSPLILILQGGLLSFLLGLVLTPIMRWFALQTHSVSTSKQDRWHARTKPLFGGLAIYGAFLISYLVLFRDGRTFWILLVGSILATALGLLDDLFRIKPSSKLIGQILIACFMIVFGVKFSLLNATIISIPLSIFWVVSMMNAVNLLDNMDGLAGGVVAISALALCGNAILNSHFGVALLMALLVGGALAFLHYNFPPAKIFMGDSGSMFLGYMLAVGAMLQAEGSVSNLVMMLAVPVLVLSVPIFDTSFVTLMRKLNQRSLSQGGKDHTSHRLVAFGLSERKAVLTLYTVSLLFGSLSFLYSRLNPVAMMVLIGLGALALFSFGIFLGDVKVYTSEKTVEKNGKKKGWVLLDGIIYHKRRIVEVLVDLTVICISYLSAFLLRFEGILSSQNLELVLDSLPIVIGIKLLSFFYFGLYRGVWRYVSLNDLVSIFKAMFVGQVVSVLCLVYLFRFEGYSRTVFIIDGILLFCLVGGSRVVLRLFREFFISLGESDRRILIMGAGDAGELALREIRNNRRLNYKLVGFIDDDTRKRGHRIHGIPVLGTRKHLVHVAKKERVQEVLIAIPSASDRQLSDVYENCEKNSILCHRMPYVITFKNGEDGTNGGNK